MTARNRRNASNSRNESSNRSVNAVRMLAKAGMLAKVLKPVTACRKANYSKDTIFFSDVSKSDVNISWTAKNSRTASNRRDPATCNRD